MHNLSITLILFIATLCSACGISETKAFRKTSEFYYNNINTPAELEIKEIKISEQDKKLVQDILPIEQALASFSKDFSKYNYVPSPIELQDLLRAYPWLSGLALTNSNGSIISQEPSYSMKNLDFSVISEQQSKLGERKPFATVLDSELGVEILMATPLYRNATLIGYFVAHFDPKTLAQLSPDPASLVLIAQDKLLWANDPNQVILADQTDLFKRTSSSINGKITINQAYLNWLTIYIADLPFIVGSISN